MQYGVVGVNKLTDKEKVELLNEIVDRCVKYAGDSYEDFARPVVKLLVKKDLVDYSD